MAFSLKMQKFSKEEIDKHVREAADILDITPLLNRKPKALSGGQRQRVAMGRAFVRDPKVFLMDEPLSNLDAKLRESMRYEIKEIQQALGMTVVYVTHDRTEAMAMSDRILLINGGVVQQSGTPREIYNRPVNPFVADFLGRVDFFRGEIRNGRVFFEEMGGQSIPCKEERTGPADVAVRPENVVLRDDGPIEGKIESLFYLGDVTDLRVRAGDALIRLTAPGSLIDEVKPGYPVRLDFKNCLYFDKGTASEEALGIKT
jgi:iron(III) transport system ATP-binding protein